MSKDTLKPYGQEYDGPSFEEFPKVDDEELTEEFFENAVLTGPNESLIGAVNSVTESQLRDMTVRFNKANATIIDKNLHIKQLEDLLRRYLP